MPYKYETSTCPFQQMFLFQYPEKIIYIQMTDEENKFIKKLNLRVRRI